MIRRGIGVQPYTAVIGGVIPLLDIYGSAAAAYSVRKLRTLYTGNAIRVRRSSDNTEQDIGFDGNGNLDESALTTFVGANNGFVTTWYDQSGNLRNLTETSATAQPQIVNSGSINKVNNDIVLSFDGTNDKLSFTLSSNLSQPATIFIVNRNSQLGSKPIFSSSDANNRWQIYRTGIGNYINIFAGSVLSSNDTTQQQVIIYSLFNGANSSISINNNAAVNGNAGTQQTNAFRVGVDNSNTFGNNDVSELIIYNSDQSANRTSILDNINTYYSIY